MRKWILAFAVLASGTAHAFSCELSETGKQYYTAMDLIFCDVNSCVTYTRLNGESGQETLKFAGCGGRWCLEESKTFNHVFPSSGRDREYVGNKKGDQVYLICYP